jgi:hypothetical protein
MITCGYNDTCYYRNDNDNKIVQLPIFRITMIMIGVVMMLMTRVMIVRIKKPRQLLLSCFAHALQISDSAHTTNTIEG